jgi:hypothetical protein
MPGGYVIMSFNYRYAKEEESKDTFSPPEGVQSAARKALKWIEEGHAGSGFTSVGRGRAHQLANGEKLSLSTIKRMHSFFSRHRVDKQGKDWNKPSPGKVAWYAWGGDAGASWAKSIVEKHDKKKDSKKEKKVGAMNWKERYANINPSDPDVKPYDWNKYSPNTYYPETYDTEENNPYDTKENDPFDPRYYKTYDNEFKKLRP